MKYILLIVIAFWVTGFVTEPAIYDLSMATIDQKQIKLDVYKGKKMLFISLPPENWNEDLIRDVNQFINRYNDKVAVIGISSSHNVMDTPIVNTDSLSKRIKSTLDQSIVFTHASYFENNGADSSCNLLRWLTMKKYNKHFEVPEYKGKRFFVDEQGNLFAVMGPTLSLMSKTIEKVVNKAP